MSPGREAVEHESSVFVRIRRSGLGGRENLRSPGQPCTVPERPCGIPAAKVAQGAGNTTRCGCTQFVWVAEIVWTHRVSSPPSCRKTRRPKEGASQEEARSPADVGREWVEGETVRGRVELQTFLERGLWVSARRFTGDRRRSRAFARLSLTGETKQGPSTRRSRPGSTPDQHIGRQGSHSGVPASDNGTSEVDTVR